jgi:hypothetical protein
VNWCTKTTILITGATARVTQNWNLENFLFFGFQPYSDWPEHPPWFAEVEKTSKRSELSFIESVGHGIKALDRCFDEAFDDQSKLHVVPLSGGLDSRAILGGVVDRVPRHNICTVTFGQPGLFDYEIAPQIAAAAGVSHELLDLREVRLETEALIAFGASLRQPVRLFQAFLHHQLRARVDPNAVICSGFFGDRPTGGHLPPDAPKRSWRDALEWFADKNRYCRSIDPTPPGWRPETSLPDAPACEPQILCFEDQLDMLIRQERFIRSVIVHDSFAYTCPFVASEWIAFFVDQPIAYRKDQRLYREILTRRFPKLFRLPTTSSMGLAAQPGTVARTAVRLKRRMIRDFKRIFPRSKITVPSGAQYLDFNSALRRPGDLREVVGENLSDLSRRGAVDWLNLEDLWDQHQRGIRNLADALTILAAAEIYLKIGDKTPAILDEPDAMKEHS